MPGSTGSLDIYYNVCGEFLILYYRLILDKLKHYKWKIYNVTLIKILISVKYTFEIQKKN